MNPTSVLRPPYIAYFRDFSGLRSWFWAAALIASILAHSFAVWLASGYVPRSASEEIRVDVRMIEPLPPPPPPLPEVVVPPPPAPPPPKPVPKPPKEVPRQAPLPILAAPPAPAAPTEPVVPVQPAPTPLPPIESPPPPPATPPVTSPPPVVAVAPAEDVDALINGFGRELSRVFAENKQYPRIAQVRNMQGKLKMKFDFANGVLVDVTLVSSSGHSLLDTTALADARRLKLPAPTGSLARQTFSIVLPVDYTIK